jgi:hypothetical protein
MTTADRIRKLGFKRWYERTLIESHAYLAMAIFGLILALGGVETVLTRASGTSMLLGVAVSLFGIFLVSTGVHRYLRMLLLATGMSALATCPRCAKYAAFNIKASGVSDADPDGPPWLRVRCRKCEHEWTIEPNASLAA